MKDIYLIDGSNILYRSFHAIQGLKTSSGRHTNAIYGFTKTLFKILKKYSPEYLTVFFDLKGLTFRHEQYSEYKLHRKPMPEELSSQVPVLKEILTLLGVKICEMSRYEADDLIATYCRQLKSRVCRVYIVTSDKDAFQLIDDGTFVINPADGEERGREWFEKKYGIPPASMTDIIGLAGDSSDNIPGVRGIGIKTAISLLSSYGSIENLYANLDDIPSDSQRKKLMESKDIAFLSKELATLEGNLPVETDLEGLRIAAPDFAKLRKIFDGLEFSKMFQELHTIYPEAETDMLDEDIIAFSSGETARYAEVIENVSEFKYKLEEAGIEKYGFSLKDKIVELSRQGILLKNPAFDVALSRHLTGLYHSGKDLFQVIGQYRKSLHDSGLENLFYNVEMPIVEVLSEMEINGIKIDIKVLRELSSSIDKELGVLEDRIYKSAGEMFNINSTMQLGTILFEKLKLPVKKKTKTGYSTDAKVLTDLSKKHILPGIILQYREIYKIKSTYIESLISSVDGKTGRIHPTYNQITTATGRLSCSNPNLQNIPVRNEKGGAVRKAFCCEEGNVFYSFDYSQIELRILADFSGDNYLIDAFRTGKDIHDETAALLFPEDSLFEDNGAGYDSSGKRRISKVINFGVLYGMSAYGLSQQLGISQGEADYFIKEYFKKFKGVKEYIESTIKKAEKDKYVTTLFNRKRYIPEIESSEKNRRELSKRIAVNTPIQGTAADIIKVAMNQIHRHLITNNLKSKMVLQIHDELLFEVASQEENSLCKNIKNIMEQAVNLSVPVKVDVKKGPNYYDMTNVDPAALQL